MRRIGAVVTIRNLLLSLTGGPGGPAGDVPPPDPEPGGPAGPIGPMSPLHVHSEKTCQPVHDIPFMPYSTETTNIT